MSRHLDWSGSCHLSPYGGSARPLIPSHPLASALRCSRPGRQARRAEGAPLMIVKKSSQHRHGGCRIVRTQAGYDCSPGSCRPGYHPPGLRPCDQERRGCRCGHLRRGGQGSLLANPLARKPLPGSEEAGELGAAYRNRTDDLRITRGMLRCFTCASCSNSTGNRTGGTNGAGISGDPVHEPVHAPGASVW
jgi:hypothetical protein